MYGFWFWKEISAKASFSQLSTHRQAWLVMFLTKVSYKRGLGVCVQNDNCELKKLSFPECFICEALEMITFIHSVPHNQGFLCLVP